MIRCAIVFGALLALSPQPGWAQPAVSSPLASMRPGVPAGVDNPPAVAYRQADQAMMQAMNRPLTGDPDRDFVNGMLPHHQGAVDMARVELRFGKDPVLRRLARTIVAVQERELTLMQDWVRRHPAP